MTSPLTAKTIEMNGVVHVEHCPRRELQRLWTRCGEGNSAGLGDQSPLCVPLSLRGMANACSLIFFFHSHVNSLSPLRSPRLLPLLLCSRRHISPCCQTVCGPHIFVYAVKLVFLLLICSMSTEFSVPPEEPRQVEEKFFLPSNCIHINHKK